MMGVVRPFVVAEVIGLPLDNTKQRTKAVDGQSVFLSAPRFLCCSVYMCVCVGCVCVGCVCVCAVSYTHLTLPTIRCV